MLDAAQMKQQLQGRPALSIDGRWAGCDHRAHPATPPAPLCAPNSAAEVANQPKVGWLIRRCVREAPLEALDRWGARAGVTAVTHQGADWTTSFAVSGEGRGFTSPAKVVLFLTLIYRFVAVFSEL